MILNNKQKNYEMNWLSIFSTTHRHRECNHMQSTNYLKNVCKISNSPEIKISAICPYVAA